MTRELTAQQVRDGVHGLILVADTSLGIEVSLPVMFPGGDLVSVTVERDANGFVVHDASSAAMYLASIDAKITKEARARFSDLVARYGCKLSGERVFRRCDASQVAVASVTVANASRAIGDYALEIRHRAENELKTALTDKVRSIVGERVRTNEEVRGKSGRLYRVQNVILDQRRRHPIAFLEAISKRASVGSHFAEFFDLKSAEESANTITIYGHEGNLRGEDLRLLEQVSSVLPFADCAPAIERLAA